MKGLTGHAVLLAVALVAAWVTWTRDESVSSEDFQTTVWSADPQAIESVTYTGGDRYLSLSRRTDEGEDYLWGVGFQRTRDSAGVRVPAPRDTVGFPVNDSGEDLLGFLAPLRAVRDLGTLESLGADRQEEYELTTPQDTLVVAFRNGEDEHLLLGGPVFGGNGRYALTPEDGRVYTVSGIPVGLLEGGRPRLEDTRLHTFYMNDIDRVVLDMPGSQRVRVRTGGTGAETTWAPPDAPAQTDATFGNFLNRVVALRPMGFVGTLPDDSLELLVRLEYQEDDGDPLGTFELFRGPPGTGEDPAVATPYYIRTERTRILALTSAPEAQRIAEDLEALFSGEGTPL